VEWTGWWKAGWRRRLGVCANCLASTLCWFVDPRRSVRAVRRSGVRLLSVHSDKKTNRAGVSRRLFAQNVYFVYEATGALPSEGPVPSDLTKGSNRSLLRRPAGCGRGGAEARGRRRARGCAAGSEKPPPLSFFSAPSNANLPCGVLRLFGVWSGGATHRPLAPRGCSAPKKNDHTNTRNFPTLGKQG
jgi:hypothetical protein